MATKTAKTAQRQVLPQNKKLCPDCGAESRVVKYAGFGRRGLFWVCEKNCGYVERTQ